MDFLKENLFEFIVSLLYILLLLLFPNKTILAFREGIILFLKTLPIFVCVVFLSSFLSLFLSPKKVQKIMGEKTGLKGVILGMAFGTVIVGPLWVLFPLYRTLLKKGARLAAVGAMIGAFAIKTPWIPYAANFLGWPFILISIGLIMVYAIIEGYLIEKILKIIPNNDTSK